MAVARSQIGAVLDILLRYLEKGQLVLLLHDLKATEAYKRNASFRETIDRISAEAQGGS